MTRRPRDGRGRSPLLALNAALLLLLLLLLGGSLAVIPQLPVMIPRHFDLTACPPTSPRPQRRPG